MLMKRRRYYRKGRPEGFQNHYRQSGTVTTEIMIALRSAKKPVNISQILDLMAQREVYPDKEDTVKVVVHNMCAKGLIASELEDCCECGKSVRYFWLTDEGRMSIADID